MKNQDIRKAIGGAGLKQWQVADALGIDDSNFSKMLRKELPDNIKGKILKAIEKLKEGER